MKKNISIIKYITFIIFCTMIISCCYKKNINNDLSNKKKFNNFENYVNQDSLNQKENKLEIQKLKSINTIYFNFDQYNILPQFFDVLNQHIVFLKRNPYSKVIIEGHADERGTPEYNIALGERRATSIKMYLQSQGVTENQIFLISYGKEKPIFLGHTEKDYEKNRCAVLIY